MKLILSVLPLAQITTAFVLPNRQAMQQIAIKRQPQAYPNKLKDSADAIWPGVDSQTAVAFVENALDNVISSATKATTTKVECHQSLSVFDAQEWITSSIKTDENLDIDESITRLRKPHEKPKHPHLRHDSLPTVYQLLTTSKNTQKFANLINEHPDLVELLNGTAANYTVFVPIDASLPDPPEGPGNPSKELVHKVLSYHISPLQYDAYSVFFARTIATTLNEEALGGYPQRIRVGFGLGGLRLNFENKIIATDILGSNGIIHIIGSLLLPPPPVSTLISHSPIEFSTLELALLKTGLDKVLQEPHTGGTLFAPTNAAFAKLGPTVNAFLFSKLGEKHLKALIQYHIVANRTMYSDAYFMHDIDEDAVVVGEREERNAGPDFHVDLPTLLKKQSLSVDVKRWGRLIDVRINGFLSLQVVDGVAKDGVVHTMGEVLIPPKNPGREPRDGEMEVEEFKRRFEGLVEGV
ncbi:Fasciclin-domain-containing protein [Stipitochalara longipes BDJ]|nr:Fasciclin-domain-containing protein [Stipitochalara longipes BDJ]